MNGRVNSVGEFTSKLAEVYLDHVATANGDGVDGRGEGVGVERQLTEAFNQLQLNVSLNQVGQILILAKECRTTVTAVDATTGPGTQDATDAPPSSSPPLSSASPPSPPPPLSWAEFCVFTVELHAVLLTQEQNRGVRERDRFRQEEEEEKEEEVSNWLRGPRRRGESDGRRVRMRDVGLQRQHGCKHEVFLGGSCNPTTWRRDIAIPRLKSNDITYFNPQVEQWYAELIEIEEQAKEEANMLLFVADNQTRAVSSMVEIANFAGIGRSMVLVVQNIEGENPRVGADVLSQREVEDLNRGRVFVRMLAEEGGSLLEPSVEDAVRSTITILKSSETVADYIARTRPHQRRHSHTLGDELRLLQQAFVLYDTDRTGSLSMEEAVLALRALRIDSPSLANFMGSKDPWSGDQLLSWLQHGISFDDFCVLYCEMRLRQLHEAGGGWGRTGGLGCSVTRSISALPSLPSSSPPLPVLGVFLGGSCGTTTWRKDVAIPILRQHGISYVNPQVNNWDPWMFPIEQRAKEQSSVLLYVVSGDTLSVASMVEAAFYIGQGRKVVLFLSNIPHSPSPEANGIKLSERALRDYNRGRAYLASIANKSHVPTFTSIADATLCAVYKVKGYRVPPASSLPLSGTSV